MTAIAGLVHEGKVYIGCDSLSSNSHTKRIVSNPKVVELKPPFGTPHPGILVGYTTSWRMGQLLQHKLSVPAAIDATDPLDYLVGQFVDAVRATFKTGGYGHIENNQESGGSFLVGYAGRLFAVQSDYSVLEAADGYDATGSGEDHAIAVLYATRTAKMKPEERIRGALEAAAEFCKGVQGPFTVKSI